MHPTSPADPSAADPLTGITSAEVTRQAFDALGADYERAFAALPELDAAVDRLLAVLPPAARVLDAGCGTGRPVADRLVTAGHRVTGIDVSPVMVGLAGDRVPDAEFLVADVRTYPSPAGSWDAVCAVFSLLTMPRRDLDATLARLAAWLAPGGRLLLATVPADVDGLDITFLGRGVRASSYPTEVLLARLRSVGFGIDRYALSRFRPDHPDADVEEHLFVDAHVS